MSEKDEFVYESWYNYGVKILYLEMLIAISVSIFAIILSFTGEGGFGGH